MTLFKETQRFNQWWFWLIVIAINGLNLVFVVNQLLYFTFTVPISDTGVIFTAIFTLLLTIFLINIKLETQINEDGIYVRFFPLQLKLRHFAWDTINKCYVRKYSPLKEYGGWGIRYNLIGKGKAYNIAGNMGLQIEFKNGDKILIGTGKSKDLELILKKFIGN